MISIKFDARKFQRELERKAHEAAKQAITKRLQPLILRGLKVKERPTFGTKINFDLQGSQELIDEAKRLLG
jgi:hypothetical protein